MQKKLIIFDMDGTLVNSSLTIAHAINYVRHNLGFEPLEPHYILSKVNDETINPAQVFYHTQQFDKDHERWFSEYYTQNHANELVLYEGIKPLLESLKAQGHALAIATNAYRVSALESLSHLEIHHLFDAIACYDDVPHGKPHPDMLHKILEELSMESHHAIFVGDGMRDQMASEKANIPYMMVDWGFTEHQNAIRSVEALRVLLLG